MLTLLTGKLKTQFNKIFWITVFWTFISIYQFFFGYAILLYFKCELKSLDAGLYFRGSILTGVLAGLIGGTAMVFLWEKWLRTKTYGRSLVYIFLTYTLTYLLVSIPSGLFLHGNEQGLSIADSELWQLVAAHFLDITQMQSYFFWLFVILGTLIILLVNDKYGPGVFRDFLLGKYFHPKREERIFMFLDLRSSTSIAERLGEERYFQFIKDVFRHATPGILLTKGEIYQYVGDEIVVSWRMDKGVENDNCLQCFFNIQENLLRLQPYYQQHYDGIVPEFKAGLHYGYVMAGEIGVVKKEITFSGDVLNTTSRIQSKCNELGVNILLSKYLLDKLKPLTNISQPKMIGELLLRGKQQKVMLYTV